MENLSEKIIPFFQNYPLIVKKQQFQRFSDIVNRLNKNEQDTKEGFERLISLVFQTNSPKGKRKYTKEEILSNPQRLYVETAQNNAV